MTHLSKAIHKELAFTLESVAALSAAILRDVGVGYVDPIQEPRLASSVTRCLDLDVTRVRRTKGAVDRLLKLFIVADELNPPRFPCTAHACRPIVIPEERRNHTAGLGMDTKGYHMDLIINCPDLVELLRLLDGEVEFGLINAPAGMIVVFRLAQSMTFALPILIPPGSPSETMPEPGTSGDSGVMLNFFERTTGNQCFARFVVLPSEFMRRMREGFECEMSRTQLAAGDLLPWIQKHLPTKEEVWRTCDYRGVARDCPVQAIWSSELESRKP